MQIPVEEAYVSAEQAVDRSLRIFKGHANAVEAVAISSNGRVVLSGSQDTTLRLWNFSNGRCMKVFHGHVGQVTAVALSQNGQFAVSASRDKTIRVWRLAYWHVSAHLTRT